MVFGRKLVFVLLLALLMLILLDLPPKHHTVHGIMYELHDSDSAYARPPRSTSKTPYSAWYYACIA
jgi:hypothetical protein